MKSSKFLIVGLLLLFFVAAFGMTDSHAEITVYDADGQFLGILDSFTTIYIPSYGRFIRISEDTGKLTFNQSLFFESNDCSGQPYSFANTAYFIFENDEKYHIGERIAPSKMSTSSIRYSSGNCVSTAREDYMVPVEEIISPITFPVSLPISYEHEPAHPGKWTK